MAERSQAKGHCLAPLLPGRPSERLHLNLKKNSKDPLKPTHRQESKSAPRHKDGEEIKLGTHMWEGSHKSLHLQIKRLMNKCLFTQDPPGEHMLFLFWSHRIPRISRPPRYKQMSPCFPAGVACPQGPWGLYCQR